MKKTKLDRYESRVEREITDAEFLGLCKRATDLVMNVFDKIPDFAPVEQTFGDFIDELNNGLKWQPVVVQSKTRRIRVSESGEIVEIEKPNPDLDGTTKNIEVSSITTEFSQEELEILESFK